MLTEGANARKSFIVDFYCHKAKLIVEIDGSQHYTDEGIEYDRERTSILEEYNLKVIRFSNYDVDTAFEGVCMEIDRMVKGRLVELFTEMKADENK